MEEFMIVLTAIIKMIKLFIGNGVLILGILLLIQLISYRCFKFNLFKKIMKILF